MLKSYYMIIVGNYKVFGALNLAETDAMAYEDYPTEENIQTAISTWEAEYARVQKRYKRV